MTPEASDETSHAPLALPLVGTSMTRDALSTSRQTHAAFMKAAPGLAAARRPPAPTLEAEEKLEFTPQPEPARGFAPGM